MLVEENIDSVREIWSGFKRFAYALNTKNDPIYSLICFQAYRPYGTHLFGLIDHYTFS